MRAFWRRKPKPVELEDGGTLTLLSRDPAWWDDPVIGLSEEEQASLRWAARNAEAFAAGCKCGRPATRVRLDHRVLGHVPVEYWTCDEHINTESWTRRGDGSWEAS